MKYYDKRQSMSIVLLAIFILSILDAVTTIIILNLGGVEVNPILSALFFISYEYALTIKFIITLTGLMGLLLIDKYIVYEKDYGVANINFYRHIKFIFFYDLSLSIVCFIYCYVVTFNIIQIIKYMWG